MKYPIYGLLDQNFVRLINLGEYLMKKLLSILLTAFLVVACFVAPPTSVEAASLSKAESLVKIAEQHAGALKWQISYELTKEIKNPDMKIFNDTKNAYLNAKKELDQLSGQKKEDLKKRLENNVGIHYTRAMGYIDAITSGKKIVDKTNKFNTLFAANPTADATEKSYHELSSEIRKQAILLYRVYGKSTRDAILVKYKTPGEKALQSSKYVISTKMHLDTLDRMIAENADQQTVETQVIGFFDLLDVIEDESIINELYETYYEIIRNDSSFLAQESEIIEFFKKSDEYANEENLEATLSLYSEEYPGYEDLSELIGSTFKDYDIKYETLGLEVQYVLEGTAFVIHDQKVTMDENDSFEYTAYYILEKDEAGNWKYLDSFDESDFEEAE